MFPGRIYGFHLVPEITTGPEFGPAGWCQGKALREDQWLFTVLQHGAEERWPLKGSAHACNFRHSEKVGKMMGCPVGKHLCYYRRENLKRKGMRVRI